jgi:hypothetical protein
MGQLSFTPAVGTHAGASFILPPVKQDIGAEDHTLTLADTGEPIDHGDGEIFAEGVDATYRDHGLLTVTLAVSGDWLLQRVAAGWTNYTANGAGILTFDVDFAQYVVEGGLGTLTDTFTGAEVGMHLGNAGGVQTSRSCTARVVGELRNTPLSYTQGVPYKELVITFKNPQAGWTYSPAGTFVSWH